MEQFANLFTALNAYSGVLLPATSVLCLLILGWTVYLGRQVRALRRRLQTLAGDGRPESWGEQLAATFRLARELETRLAEQHRTLTALEGRMSGALQRVGLVRFNAFSNVGSDLSFAAAILDDQANGLVLTSIYARDESRTFAKPVTGGTSPYRLTPEEEKAIALALDKPRPAATRGPAR